MFAPLQMSERTKQSSAVFTHCFYLSLEVVTESIFKMRKIDKDEGLKTSGVKKKKTIIGAG